MGMNTTAGLIVLLMVYALAGVVLGFNLWGASDQLALHWRGKPWLSRQIGRDNPMAWRAGGLMMLAFGVVVGAWIVVSSAWQLPAITAQAALFVLGLVAATCLVVLMRRQS